jgi:hypothetical protein
MGEACPAARAAASLRPPGMRRAAAGTCRRWSCVGLQDPRRPARLVHACIVMSLVAGVRPDEARAIWPGEDGIGARRRTLPELVKAAARTHAEMSAPIILQIRYHGDVFDATLNSFLKIINCRATSEPQRRQLAASNIYI